MYERKKKETNKQNKTRFNKCKSYNYIIDFKEARGDQDEGAWLPEG